MSPETIFKGAIRIYTQGTPCTPEIAVDIARRIAKSVEAFEAAHTESALAAHGVAEEG